MPVSHPASQPHDHRREAREALEEAREALAYWEERADRLPRRAVRARREAQEHVRRWEQRVATCERERYGAGVTGALVLLATERRLPQPTRLAGGRLVRRARRTVRLLAAAAVAVTVAVTAVAVQVIVRAIDALG
jgi:hypothetical protein